MDSSLLKSVELCDGRQFGTAKTNRYISELDAVVALIYRTNWPVCFVASGMLADGSSLQRVSG